MLPESSQVLILVEDELLKLLDAVVECENTGPVWLYNLDDLFAELGHIFEILSGLALGFNERIKLVRWSDRA